jgi:DNA-binding response OmpR family regulator
VLDQPVLSGAIELALAHVRGDFFVRVVEDEKGVKEMVARWRPDLAVVDVDLARGTIMASLGYPRVTKGRAVDGPSDAIEGLPVDEPGPAGDRPRDRPGEPARGARIPVVALTRRGDVRAKLSAFEQGVDDLLAVPFSPEELVARVVAVLRRTAPHTSAALQPLLRLGALEIDLLNRSVRIDASALHLTALEQSLLYLLVANAGRVLTRDEILDHLWGVDFVAESNVVDRHIRNLRIKLRDDWRRPRFIFTVPGLGYRFMPGAERVAARPPAGQVGQVGDPGPEGAAEPAEPR